MNLGLYIMPIIQIPGVLSPVLNLHFITQPMSCFVLWQQNVKLTTTCWSASTASESAPF